MRYSRYSKILSIFILGSIPHLSFGGTCTLSDTAEIQGHYATFQTLSLKKQKLTRGYVLSWLQGHYSSCTDIIVKVFSGEEINLDEISGQTRTQGRLPVDPVFANQKGQVRAQTARIEEGLRRSRQDNLGNTSDMESVASDMSSVGDGLSTDSDVASDSDLALTSPSSHSLSVQESNSEQPIQWVQDPKLNRIIKETHDTETSFQNALAQFQANIQSSLSSCEDWRYSVQRSQCFDRSRLVLKLTLEQKRDFRRFLSSYLTLMEMLGAISNPFLDVDPMQAELRQKFGQEFEKLVLPVSTGGMYQAILFDLIVKYDEFLRRPYNRQLQKNYSKSQKHMIFQDPSQFGISDYFIMPIQRAPRLMLLSREILKHSNKVDPNYPLFLRIQENAEKSSQELNEKKRIYDAKYSLSSSDSANKRKHSKSIIKFFKRFSRTNTAK